jgi:NAD(P)-dependent dehydrogenase (short-subunit alcohol dehydrogenase family)
MTKGRILITGATSGIGRAAVERFAALGWEVFATGRSEAKRRELAASTKDGRVHVVALDVDRAESIATCQEEILRLTDGYGVDVVVNNAGFARVSPIAELTDEDLRGHFDTNVFAVVAIARAFLPGMMARGAGRIVNVSSSGGRMSLPFVGAYHAAKFAVEALSDAMRWELAPFGIHVSVIEPGPVKTPFADLVIASAHQTSSASPYAPALADFTKLQRLAERNMIAPEVVVRDLVHAASAKRPRARYVEPRWLALVIALANLTPACILDRIITRMFGLDRLALMPRVSVPG